MPSYSEFVRFLYKHPKLQWLLLLVIIAYLLIPVDFWPEVLFGPSGLVDDGVVLSLLVSTWLHLKRLNRQSKLKQTDS